MIKTLLADDIAIIKLNLDGEVRWQYNGRTLERGDEQIVIKAYFQRPDIPFHGIVLGRGDCFIETFYSDRWYNIFEMHDRQDNHLKGWYCNVAYPAMIEQGRVSYVDLALDLLVYPDGRQLVLDEDEFAELPLSTDVKEQALVALAELQACFEKKFREQV